MGRASSINDIEEKDIQKYGSKIRKGLRTLGVDGKII
jgi:hypothetical protein